MPDAPDAKEITWIIDQTTGELTVEGLTNTELAGIAADLLPKGALVNCARPLNAPPLQGKVTEDAALDDVSLQIFRIYHGSVVEGPGRRSVIQTSGCPIICPNCFTPETHDPNAGVRMSVEEVVRRVLNPAGAPRDGVTILGGEPFYQPDGLLAVIRKLRILRQHITLYTGYRLESLRARRNPAIDEALRLTDILIDGPFIAQEAHGAGEWVGSRNQRIIQLSR